MTIERLDIATRRDVVHATTPDVFLDPDICAALRIGLTTLKKLRRLGAFPIPELPALDKRHRYARQDVIAYLSRTTTPALVRRRA